MAKWTGTTQGHGGGYSHVRRVRRTKADWAGVGIGGAFNRNLDYYLRRSGQRQFYRMMRKAQTAAARLAGAATEEELKPLVKPQLTPCYSTFPATPAAHAAVGLTAFLEFKARVAADSLVIGRLEGFLEDPAAADAVDVDPDSYRTVASEAARWVQTRLLMEEIAHGASIPTLEIYRLFSASQENLAFRSLSEIIRCVVLYGDVLPEWGTVLLHPLTRKILEDLTATCHPYFQVLGSAAEENLLRLGELWVRAICHCLAGFLPPPGPDEAEGERTRRELQREVLASAPSKYVGKFIEKFPQPGENPRIAPLDGLVPPVVDEPASSSRQIAEAMAAVDPDRKDQIQGEKDLAELSMQPALVLAQFEEAIQAAGGQGRSFEDIRSDILERSLRTSPFHDQPIEGNPADGHEVSLELAGGKEASGEIFDQAVELSEDLPGYEKLLEEARPITQALRRCLYPNIEQVPEIRRFRTSGAIDPARLPVAGFASTVFRRFRIRERADRRGQPLLVIACDASGSLSESQMKMVKVLAASWLHATARTGIEVLAGLYHSGRVRGRESGPLVQWIYHPRKTPATSRRDAARALVSLPASGTGVQSDALSLAFIMQEAKALARGRSIYLVLLTDTAWNRSFRTEQSGAEEVRAFFEKAGETYPGRLHSTMVALGVSGVTGLEDLLDAVIRVPEEDLEDFAALAEKIAVYVAGCIRSRSRIARGR